MVKQCVITNAIVKRHVMIHCNATQQYRGAKKQSNTFFLLLLLHKNNFSVVSLSTKIVGAGVILTTYYMPIAMKLD